MTALQLLSYLRHRNIHLWIEEGYLEYEAPEGALTETLRTQIKNHKSQLLDILSASSHTSESVPLMPCSREQSLPLSFAQQRLWFLEQLEPDSTAYLMSSAFRLSGPLAVPTLEASLRCLVQRHEALRTRFVCEHDIPTQVIATEVPVELPVCNLEAISPQDQPQEVARLIDEEAHRLFDLARGPLFRFQLLTLGPEAHVLQLTFHHIIFDGWSMQVFFRELTGAYTSFCTGESLSLPSLPIQYVDYAVWQRAYLQEEALERQLTFWRTQLQQPLPTLSLPTDYPRPAILASQGDCVSFQIAPELTAGLRAVSRQANATLFMTVLAAFQLLLHRFADQDDVCVGVPSAGRTCREIQDVMGFFINTLVVRTELGGNPTFTDLLEQVRSRCLDAYAHQDVPFEKLVEILQPVRDLSRTPFFQVFFNMMPGTTTSLSLPGLTVTPIPKTSRESKFDLTVFLRENSEQLTGTFVYNATLFCAERIETIVAQYQKLLHQIVVTSDLPIQHYSLLTDESYIILPDPHRPLQMPSHDSVPTSICAWATRAPDHVAVQHGSTTLRYGELLHRSEVCARVLQQQGVAPGDVVLIRGPRSIGFITTLLGVWLAGGVVLPLDPQLPGARQTFMRESSGARFLVQVRASKEPTSETENQTMPCLVVDASTGIIESSAQSNHASELNLPPTVTEGPAYIFFTSGTTGTPKGILGSHQALAHFLAWQRKTFDIGPQDRVAQFTSLSFEPVLRDFFLPLTCGAAVCLPPEEAGGEEHLRWIAAEGVTVIHLVPSIASFLLTASALPVLLPSLRWVFFGGEPLTAELLEHWRTVCPGTAQFVNLYGPTETTLAKSWYLVPPDRTATVQPIGQPLPQTQILVLGEDYCRCGIGEVGELAIRTPFRSLGYLQTDNDNSHRFVPNPFRDDPSDLLYLTGDLGRYRLDGTMDILGRRDDQIKIRGVRIEPQEIMGVLHTCPEVQSCTVLTSRDKRGEMGLTAYVVPHPHTELTSSTMRAYLSNRLPSAMLPSRYVLLDYFPLTPNGKIDRQALLTLPSIKTAEQEWVAPRTVEESLLIKIWQEVLKREPIGVHDNFFDRGGHSLLATQVIARIRSRFQMNLPLRTLFEHPTVAGLAVVLAQTQRNTSGDDMAEDNLVDLLDDIDALSEEEAQKLIEKEDKEIEENYT